MPRTDLTYNALSGNGSLASPAAATIDATLVTNGAAIQRADTERTLLRVTNTAGTPKTVTVKAGKSTAARMGSQGDLTVTVAATNGEAIIGPFSSVRFLQLGEQLQIDFATGFTGTITALKIPRHL